MHAGRRLRSLPRTLLSALGALALLLLSGLFCLLPREWAHGLGRRLGRLAYLVSRRSRETALENLRLRLGLDGAAARRVAVASLMQAGASVVDLLRAPRMTRSVLERDLEIPPDTRALLEELRRSPRGVVFASCHVGNWEFLNLCAPFLLPGRPSMVVVRPPPYPLVGRLLRGLRGRTGQRVVHRTGAVRRARDHVRAGGVVEMMADVSVPPQAGAAAVGFFGVPTYTTLAPGYLAARTGAPLALCYTLPLGMQRYRFVLRRIDAPAGRSPRETAVALTERLSQAIEAAIRDCPDAWAWWLKRWNVRPEGAPGAWPSYSAHERCHLAHGRVPKDA